MEDTLTDRSDLQELAGPAYYPISDKAMVTEDLGSVQAGKEEVVADALWPTVPAH